MNVERVEKRLIDVTNINEKIYRLIKERIIHQEYPPGYQINIRKLQDELGVSSSPIKDALYQLAGEGFVDITSRKGTYVKDVSREDMIEIEQLRTILEIGALDLFFENVTDEQLALLEQTHQEMATEKQYETFMEKDRKFHLDIISLTNNKRLIDTYKSLNAHSQIVRFKFASQRTSPDPATIHAHGEILRAMKNRDMEAAKRAIQNHRRRWMTSVGQ